MTGEGHELRSTAVRNLITLGLSEYAARTLVALVRIGGGTAREVSDTSSVPRTRVYDAVNELAERGFVRIRESHPKEFTPASPGRIGRAFYREYVYRQIVAEWGLRALDPTDVSEWGDVDVEEGTDAVDRCLIAGIADADEQLTYVTVGDRLSQAIRSALDDATDRGVVVQVVCVGDVDPDDVRAAVPAATVISVPNTAMSPSEGSRFLLADESLAVLGIRSDPFCESTELGLVSEGSDTDITALLQGIVDTWLADAG